MKTVFVTGGGKGLGRAFAEYFLQNGFRVFIGVRNIHNIDEAISKNPNLFIIELDVLSDASIHNAFTEVKKQTDHLDYLINNAGLMKATATNNRSELVCNLKDLSRKHLNLMFEVNSVAPILIVKEFLPLLTVKLSFIINISSGSSSYRNEYPNRSGNYGYRASKAALNIMTYASLHDLPNNVKTFAVHPGGIKTEGNPLGTMNPITQVEKVIAITKNWKEAFNGKFLRFDGTLYPL